MGRAVSALIGYNVILLGLLMDIDMPNGQDGLSTVFA